MSESQPVQGVEPQAQFRVQGVMAGWLREQCGFDSVEESNDAARALLERITGRRLLILRRAENFTQFMEQVDWLREQYTEGDGA